jgi:antitoxin HicB
MQEFDFAYPVRLARDAGNVVIVSFRDLPEALTQGDDLADALAQAADCLDEAIANRVAHGLDIPAPSAARRGERLVPLPAQAAAQAALYLALRDAGISKSELARRLGCDEKEARRLLDPRHPSKIERLEAALHAVGAALQVGLRKAG